MIERPILMSGAMVRATLREVNPKSQTRRIVKLPHNNSLGRWEPTTFGGPNGGRTRAGATIPLQGGIWHTRTGDCLMSLYGQPGDRLWVRETWLGYWGPPAPNAHQIIDAEIKQANGSTARAAAGDPLSIHYAADNALAPFGRKWTPSIHMPRWASRITLELTNVRVERLQDLDANAAIAEGVQPTVDGAFHIENDLYRAPDSIECFARLWDSLNDARGFGWNTNPWVWVIEFKRVKP